MAKENPQVIPKPAFESPYPRQGPEPRRPFPKLSLAHGLVTLRKFGLKKKPKNAVFLDPEEFRRSQKHLNGIAYAR